MQKRPVQSEIKATRILIVDDDILVVELLKDFLEGEDDNLMIEVAYDGFEAGHKVHTFSPDVVLLDYMMPGLKGTEVCRSLKQSPDFSALRIIAMSGYLDAKTEAELLAAGAECCLKKPLDFNLLMKKIA